MKAFTVMVIYANGKRDFFKSTKLEEAYAKFNEWKADFLSVYVGIA